MKKKLVLVLVCIIAVLLFSLLRDFVIKNVITAVSGSVLGAETSIDGFSLSIIRQSVKITNLKIYSPKGFVREVMVDIPLTRVSVDIFSILRGKIHLKELTLELKEMCLVKNKEGKLNVDSLKIAESKGKEAKPDKQMPIQIDLVQLDIGKVVNKDYSVNGPVAIKVYDVGIKKSYKNISSVEQLAALIIAEPLKAAGIRGLAVYSVSMLTGVAALPVAVAFTVTGKDYAQAEYKVPWDKAYEVGLSVLKESGTVNLENKARGTISAHVSGALVAFKLKKISQTTTQITVSARKNLLPRPEIASGIIYRIADKLK